LREVYAPLDTGDIPFVVTDPVMAELVKASADAFLATKISFINAIAQVCEAVSADIHAVAEAIGYDPPSTTCTAASSSRPTRIGDGARIRCTASAGCSAAGGRAPRHSRADAAAGRH
jgi:hypothetical protein